MRGFRSGDANKSGAEIALERRLPIVDGTRCRKTCRVVACVEDDSNEVRAEGPRLVRQKLS